MSEKKRPEKGEKRNIESSMTLLIFLSRLQIENYVMTAFSIQPIRKKNEQQIMFSQLREAVANFNIPVLTG